MGIPVILGVVGFGSYELYTLNREIGEIEAVIDSVNKDVVGIDEDIGKSEARVERSAP